MKSRINTLKRLISGLTLAAAILVSGPVFASGNNTEENNYEQEAYNKALAELETYLEDNNTFELENTSVEIYNSEFELVSQFELSEASANEEYHKLLSLSDLLMESENTAIYIINN